jgi:hypothetical protein
MHCFGIQGHDEAPHAILQLRTLELALALSLAPALALVLALALMLILQDYKYLCSSHNAILKIILFASGSQQLAAGSTCIQIGQGQIQNLSAYGSFL